MFSDTSVVDEKRQSSVSLQVGSLVFEKAYTTKQVLMIVNDVSRSKCNDTTFMFGKRSHSSLASLYHHIALTVLKTPISPLTCHQSPSSSLTDHASRTSNGQNEYVCMHESISAPCISLFTHAHTPPSLFPTCSCLQRYRNSSRCAGTTTTHIAQTLPPPNPPQTHPKHKRA